MDIISQEDAFEDEAQEEDDDYDRPDPKQELKLTLAQIRKKNKACVDEKLLKIIQEKDVEDESKISVSTKSLSVEESSSNDSHSNALMSLDGIFGIVQQNNDLFEVMNDKESEETDAYKFVCEKSQGCVEQSTKRAYYAHQKLQTKLTVGFVNQTME